MKPATPTERGLVLAGLALVVILGATLYLAISLGLWLAPHL